MSNNKDSKRTIIKGNDFDDMFEGRKRKDLNPTEYMMTYCRSKKYNFQFLLNDTLFALEPTSETYKNDKEDAIIESILDFNTKEMKKLKNNVNFGRNAMSLIGEQKYMMSFAWVNPKELVLLEAFPEVIMVNTTEKTNNEKGPLLTTGGMILMGICLFFYKSSCQISNPGCLSGSSM